MNHAPPRSPLDGVGIVLSTACAVHCVLTPLLVVSASQGVLHWLASEQVESAFLTLALTTALVALGCGWRQHRRLESIGLFAVAAAMVSAGRTLVSDQAERVLVVGGGLMVALAHVVNASLCRCCTRCGPTQAADQGAQDRATETL